MGHSRTLIRGRIQSGTRKAEHWLALLNDAYARKTGMAVFPGSLNVGLEKPFDWFDQRWSAAVVRFPREENGGERDILLLPCSLDVAAGMSAFLWSTTTAAEDPADRMLAEVIAPVNLRAKYGLNDGDVVVIEIDLMAGDPD